MSTRQPSRVVFVGNIPYGEHGRNIRCFNVNFADSWRAGLTEEQITEIFSGAGRVLNFRLVYDRETGRPKGFGFAEFPDYGAFPFLHQQNKNSSIVDPSHHHRLCSFSSPKPERLRNHGSQVARRL